MAEKAPVVALVSTPGLTHLIPLVEFAKRLSMLYPHDFHFKFLIPTIGPPSSTVKSILQSLPSTMSFILLPQVNIEDLPAPDIDPTAQVLSAVSLSLPFLHQQIKLLSSSTRLVALVVDAFAIDAVYIAKEFNIMSYAYYTSNAFTLCLCLYFPKLHETTSLEFRDLPEPVRLPGCEPVHGSDLPMPLQDRSSNSYKSFLHICERLHLADGIIINSFKNLEIGAFQALQEKQARNPPIFYPVGPMTGATGTSNTTSSSSIRKVAGRWLDDQPPNSVLYVSFGSVGTLSQDQLNELALGLELSGHKFLWVARAPSKSVFSANLNLQEEDPLNYLPFGFLERTKEQGLVVPSWAPQIEVLSHRSTYGFLSHCGWNSTLESMAIGKPIIAWPLFAEQKMNAVLLSDGLKVALRLKANEKGIVEREEIAKVIKTLKDSEEGIEIRKRMEELKYAAAESLKEEGSSTRSISELALKWKNLRGK